MSVDPHKTYALVVGVEKYATGSKWDLDGPVSDANKFVDWLHEWNVPDENIFLYLSPLAQNAVLVGSKTQAATRERIYQALTTILPSKKEGALFYFFWGGHGMITPDYSRLLFYADATQQNILSLDLNSLLTSLRSNYFPGFARQIFFIDACSNYVVNWRLYGTLPHETFPGGDPVATREQFVCLAAKSGEYAINITVQQTGLFSKMVREELAKQGTDSWPPAMEELATSLAKRFTSLRAEGKVKQTPTHFWYKNWDSTERLFGEIPASAGSPGLKNATLTSSQRRMLTDLLHACDTMARRETREQPILKDLRYEIRVNLIRDYQSDRFDIRGIVDTCLNYSGGLHELIEIVHYYEGDSLSMHQVQAFMEQVPPEL